MICRGVKLWKGNNENRICLFLFSAPSLNVFSCLSVFERYKWSFGGFSSKVEIPSAKSLTASKVPCFHNRKVPDYQIGGWKLEQSFFPMSPIIICRATKTQYLWSSAFPERIHMQRKIAPQSKFLSRATCFLNSEVTKMRKANYIFICSCSHQ